MGELVSYREYARRRGISDTSVRQMIDEGRISKNSIVDFGTKRPKIDVDLANNDLARGNSPRSNNKQTRASLGRVPPPAINPPAEARKIIDARKSNKQIEVEAALLIEDMELDDLRADGINIPGVGGLNLDEDPTDGITAREQELIFKAIKLKIEVYKLRGLLVDKNRVNVVLGTLATLLKHDILSIPRDIAANAHACETPFDLELMFYKALENVFIEHSDIQITESKLKALSKTNE